MRMREKKPEIVSCIFYPLVIIIVLSWGLGSLGASWAWLLIAIGGAWAFVRGTIKRVTDAYIRFESLLVHRRRALQSDETCEWLNFLLSRFWVFSSATIFNHVKSFLDPRLVEVKPSFVENISLKQLTLGDRTPFIRYIKSWDANDQYRSACSLHTPKRLSFAPIHPVAILCDFSFDSDTFSAILAARIGHKGVGVDLDVGVENVFLEGRLLITVYLDSDSPFPHVARATFSFIEQPKLSFRVKILKSVQMMEVPVLKTWIYNLVSDAIETALVDPGQVEVNINSTEGFVPEHRAKDTLAHGVITVILKLQKGISGSALNVDEDKWVVVSIDGKSQVSTTIRQSTWQHASSFLLLTPLSATNLTIKIKTKKLITTTLTQYELPLSQYGLEVYNIAESVLNKKGTKVMGGSVPPLYMKIEYTQLVQINLDSSISFLRNEPDSVAGVLFVEVHGADNLVSNDSPPSPYCLIFSSRKKVKTTHFVPGSASPRWECGVEILVSDVFSVCLTFVVCSVPKNPRLQDGEFLGIYTLNLNTEEFPMIKKKFPLNQNLSSPTSDENVPSNSSLTATIFFRSVPSISGSSICLKEVSPVPHMSMNSSSGVSFSSKHSPPNLRVSTSHSVSSAPSGILENEEMTPKKKTNSFWLHQAKHFLGSGCENESSCSQDLSEILASGLGLIELHIIRARDLVAKDLNGFSDPYCVVKVNGEAKYRTRVKKKTLDPHWNESLLTHLPRKHHSLVITLWDHDAFGMKDFLGSLNLSEEDIRLFCSSVAPVWSKLQGVKSGSLELKLKLISEDFEFDSGSRRPSSFGNNEISRKVSAEETVQNVSTYSFADSERIGEFSLRKSSNLSSSFKNLTEFKRENRHHCNTLLRTSSIPLITNILSSKECLQEKYDSDNSNSENYFPALETKQTLAEILACDLALTKPETQGSLSTSHPETLNTKIANLRRKSKTPVSANSYGLMTPSSSQDSIQAVESKFALEKLIHHSNASQNANEVPKISLNIHSEDGCSNSDKECEEHVKTKSNIKKKGKKKFNAMKKKVCQGLVRPIRRFKSEVNVFEGRDSIIAPCAVSMEDIPDSDLLRLFRRK